MGSGEAQDRSCRNRCGKEMMDRKTERAMKTIFSVVGCAIAFAACADSGFSGCIVTEFVLYFIMVYNAASTNIRHKGGSLHAI